MQSLAIIQSRAQVDISAPEVTVEVHITSGLPSLTMVGLPETVVKESKDRVRGAIINSGFEFPIKKISINLAPADLPKVGGRFDLPIALGILAASKQISCDFFEHYEFMGELALSGELRPVKGILASILAIKQAKKKAIIALQNQYEASLVKNVDIYGASNLLAVCAHLQGAKWLTAITYVPRKISTNIPDMSDIKGQAHGRRALEIAASGQHSLLMMGPPGTGKTMLASRISGILPELTDQLALEVATIASISNQGIHLEHWKSRPFRDPHHTASGVALVGGGSPPKPGEISMAHHGVLFLDELPEFNRKVLEVLREPLESGKITIARAAFSVVFPAKFQLVCAMNPCPCGYFDDPFRECQCSLDQVRRYRAKISGPLLDRIDMHVEIPRLAQKELRNTPISLTENSETVRKRVVMAQERQQQRCGRLNSMLDHQQIEKYCALSEENHQLLDNAMEKLQLSARAYHRILKLARTIADLDHQTSINSQHLSEAIAFRRFDRPLTI